MSHARSCFSPSFLRDDSIRVRGLRGGDSSDSSDGPVEVFYDHRSRLPQHELTDSTTVRSGGGLAHQPPRLIPGHRQKQPSVTPVPSAPLTSSLNSAHKGSVDRFPASTFTSAASCAISPAGPFSMTALGGVVDEAVVTMDHAVRVPCALRGAGRRTMFDVLVDVAARQRRPDQRQAKPQVSAEDRNITSDHVATARDLQAPAPHPSGTAVSSLGISSSAREITYQLLFPQSTVAAAARRLSSSTTTNSVSAAGSVRELCNGGIASTAPVLGAVVAALPGRETRAGASASPVRHRRTTPLSALPPQRAKPDRRLLHLLPAHLRGGLAASQSADDDSQERKLQRALIDGTNRLQTPPVRNPADATALDASDMSSISSFSDGGDTRQPDTRYVQPHLGTRPDATDVAAAAPMRGPQAPQAVTHQTSFSGLIDGDAEVIARHQPQHAGPKSGQPERPQRTTEDSEAKWARLEQVFMGAAEAVVSSSLAEEPTCVRDRLHHSHSGHRRVDRGTARSSLERSTTHLRTTDVFASDPDSASSGMENSVDDGGGVLDLRKDLDDEVPRWVRQHEAARGHLAQLRQQRRVPWASPTFRDAHMYVVERAAAAYRARALVAATAAASQALVGKPRIFCPSSMVPRTPSAASHPASELVGGAAAWSAARGVGRGTPVARGIRTPVGAQGSLLTVWKEGKRLLKQRSSNTTAVAVVEYLWQRFQAWKPYGLQLLRQLRRGICFGEAAAPPVGSPLSRSQRESDSGCLVLNPAWDGPAGDAVEPTEEILGTSSDEDRTHTSVLQRKAAWKSQRCPQQAVASAPSQQWHPAATAGSGTDAASEAGHQSEGEGRPSDAGAAEEGGSGDEGVELQLRVHYMESAFNVVAVHGELTYASESACARLGLAYPLLSSPRLPSCVRDRAEDAATTRAAQQRQWTLLLPEPALMQVPVLLQEHIYLAPPYTVCREMQTVLASYNFTSDALLRQHAEEEEVFQGGPQRRRATGAAGNAVSEGHAFDTGYGDSGDRRCRVSPTSQAVRARQRCRSRVCCGSAAQEGNGRAPVREAAPTDAQMPAHPTEEPATTVSPPSLYRELGGTPLNVDPARLHRTPTLEHPQRQQWLVAGKEGTYPRAQAAGGVEAHTPTAVRQGGCTRMGASPEPHHPVARGPPPLPRLREAGSGSDAVYADARWRQSNPPAQASLSPSCVRASPASVNSIAVDGFYDPLAMPALPIAGAERGMVKAWGDSGGGTRGLSSAMAGVTMVVTRDSVHDADHVVGPAHALERRLAGGPRELPIPPQLVAPLSSTFSQAVAASASDSVSNGGVEDGAEARGCSTLAAAVSAAPLMDCRIGDGFPRGPSSDWDVPVEVLFALSRGGGRWMDDAEQPAPLTCRHRDADVDGRSEGDDGDGAFEVRHGPAGACSLAATPAKLAQEPVGVRKRHRHETRTSGDAFTATASHLASQKLPSSAIFSSPTPHSQSASTATSLASSTAPSFVSLSSLSEPQDECVDGAESGDAPQAARASRGKANGRGAMRWPRHGARRSRLGGAIASRPHQKQQQERWMRVLWGRGKHHDEPYTIPAAPSGFSAVARAPAECSPHQQQTSSQRHLRVRTSSSLSLAADASISVPTAVSTPARAAPVARGPEGDGAAILARSSSPLTVDVSAAMEPHLSGTASLSALAAVVRSASGAPVLYRPEDADASTATTAFFALEDVYLSDSE
ncbi:hypothetical protein GH5_07455 [Leishmania sp. Ghana 2012 LV757]|uniref:hypothetical protein n=1 Tax=Leishmania sp. Ghana 2012 LV757 TaxID=2803181 RepID=UPI001B5AB0BD|nr:hypothetical protein GH5_07455 [Leishmania sp. Ghana 2012 LV757]